MGSGDKKEKKSSQVPWKIIVNFITTQIDGLSYNGTITQMYRDIKESSQVELIMHYMLNKDHLPFYVTSY